MGGGAENVTTCWKVGLFVQRIVFGRIPEVNLIRSAVASARQAPWALGSRELRAGWGELARKVQTF